MPKVGVVAATVLLYASAAFSKSSVRFSQSAASVEAYDFVEVAMAVDQPNSINCFTRASVTGSFTKASGSAVQVEGFCDSTDGSVYRIRFMPSALGDYTYHVALQAGALKRES